MREVINLSLPPEMAQKVRHAVKKGGYSSVSEFFRELLRAWMREDHNYQESLKKIDTWLSKH